MALSFARVSDKEQGRRSAHRLSQPCAVIDSVAPSCPRRSSSAPVSSLGTIVSTHGIEHLQESQSPNVSQPARGCAPRGLDCLEHLDLLARGSFGAVTSVKCRRTGCKYILKALSKVAFKKKQMWEKVLEEQSVLSRTNSPFVIGLEACFDTGSNLYFLMESTITDLHTVLEKNDLFGSETHARFYVACIASGIDHLHKQLVVYRDLKPENVVVDARGYAKLCDCGLATYLQPSIRLAGSLQSALSQSCGIGATPEYMAPEILDLGRCSIAANWWSVGAIAYEMMTGRSPFDADKLKHVFKNIKAGITNVQFPTDHLWPELVRGLCSQKPAERLPMLLGGIRNVQELEWFRASGFDWEAHGDATMLAPSVPSVASAPNPTKAMRAGVSDSQSTASGSTTSSPPRNRLPSECLSSVDTPQPQLAVQECKQHAEVRLADLEPISSLIQGSFGQAVTVRCRVTGQTLHLKALSKARLRKKQMWRKVQEDKTMLAQAHSPFVLNLAASYDTAQHVCFLMEATTTDLYTVFQENKLFGSPHHARFYVACIASGLDHLHRQLFIYRDLKPENVLIDVQGYAKLGDSGLASFGNSVMSSSCGTPEYMAPEILLNGQYSFAGNWWALGVLTYEMMMERTPFDADEVTNVIRQIQAGIDKVEFPPACDWPEFVRGLCKQTPSERLHLLSSGIQNIQSHRWFRKSEFDWEAHGLGHMVAPHIPESNALGGMCSPGSNDVDLPSIAHLICADVSDVNVEAAVSDSALEDRVDYNLIAPIAMSLQVSRNACRRKCVPSSQWAGVSHSPEDQHRTEMVVPSHIARESIGLELDKADNPFDSELATSMKRNSACTSAPTLLGRGAQASLRSTRPK